MNNLFSVRNCLDFELVFCFVINFYEPILLIWFPRKALSSTEMGSASALSRDLQIAYIMHFFHVRLKD